MVFRKIIFQNRYVALETPSRTIALSSEQSPQTPAYASKQKSKKFLQASIFLRTNSAHNQYQKDVIEICTGNLPKRFVHEGFWEVLDEGIGGSLKTHLQEVLPSCKGEQSLTFKRHQGSTVARCISSKSSQATC